MAHMLHQVFTIPRDPELHMDFCRLTADWDAQERATLHWDSLQIPNLYVPRVSQHLNIEPSGQAVIVPKP